jgi:phosphatidate cytidylyltransferase
MSHMNELILRSITSIFIGIIILGSLFFLPPIIFSGILISVLCYILCFEWHRLARSNAGLWLLTPLYPIIPFLILLYFNQSDTYRPLLIFLFIITFCNDVGAYLVGKHLGIHTILSTISPKKTWEGFAGGYLFILIALLIIKHITEAPIPYLSLAIFGLLCASIATMGDFFESWLKRKAHIKDTGRILPGHGGFLDRFDSVLFLAFLFFIIKNLSSLINLHAER